MTYLLAIDQGTTSSRAILFDASGHVQHVAQKELKLIYPHKGWVEQNPNDILTDTVSVARAAMKQKPVAIGITNQRETTILWNRKTGRAIYNAIVWQDKRTADICDQFKALGHESLINQKTGLLLDPYFSATKISWILDHVDGARDMAERGELAFGTVDCFLLWHLTGGKVHATDATNASRTMIFNIVTQAWDDELLSLFNIPKSILPEVRDTVSDFGTTSADMLGAEIPICAMVGDQQGALVGQGCFEAGLVKATYGTGCFALMNIGHHFKTSKNRLLTTVAYRFNGQVTYALEGSIFMAGAAIQWLRDNLNIITTAAETEKLARSVPDSNDVIFVPAFAGLGAPYWDAHARAAIFGLTRDTTKAHIVRAILEAQAFQTKDLIDAFSADTGIAPKVIRADGGLINNSFVAQAIADVLAMKVDVPENTETTAWGVAALAGLGAGVFKTPQDIAAQWRAGHQYKAAQSDLPTRYKDWGRAIAAIQGLSVTHIA